MCDVVVYTVVDHYNLFLFTLCLSNSQAKSGEWQQLSHGHEHSTRWPKLVGERVRYCECLRGRSHCTKKMVHFCRILTSSGSLLQRRDSIECLLARKGRHVQPPPRFVVEGAQGPHVVRPQARDRCAVRDAGGYRAATTAFPAESGVQQEQRGHQDHPDDH